MLGPSIHSPTTDARTAWRSEVSEALRRGQVLLSATTTFPRAGSVNHPVIAFVDLCVSLADRYPLLDREAISVLWWAMSYTFQSPSVLRHLTRLLASVGESDDARRMYELYVRLVLKDRETHQPEISLQLKRRPTEGPALSPVEIHQEVMAVEEQNGVAAGKTSSTQRAEAETESDENFIGALLVGSRLFLRNLGDAEEAWSYVSLAGDVVRNASKRQPLALKDSLRGEVEECKGIIRMAMGMRGEWKDSLYGSHLAYTPIAGGDPVVRPSYQAQSLDHLRAAIRLDSSSGSIFYHLSYCQAEARAIEDATESIRRAIEIRASDIQAWHLLALLLTAQGDWDAAAKACEAGVAVWEQEEERELLEAEGAGSGGNPDDSDPAIETKDFAGSTSASGPSVAIIAPPSRTNSEPLLFASGEFKPTQIMTRPTHPPAVNRVVRLEHVIRLRMTANVIAEKTQGCEVAMLRQQELFGFFSARSGKNRGQGIAVGRALPGSASMTSFAPPETQLEAKTVESFVDLNIDTEPAEAGRMENSVVAGEPHPLFTEYALTDLLTTAVQPPTPGAARQTSSSFPSPQAASTATNRTASLNSSPGISPNTSESESPRSNRPMSLQDGPKDNRRNFSGGRSLSGTKRLMAKHLHVPHQPRSRPSSIRRASRKEDLSEHSHNTVCLSSGPLTHLL